MSPYIVEAEITKASKHKVKPWNIENRGMLLVRAPPCSFE